MSARIPLSVSCLLYTSLEYDLSEMMDNEEIQEMARDVESLRKELYLSLIHI